MGNNACSLCNNQTSITSINRLSLNLQKSNNNNKNRKLKLLESIKEKNIESLMSLNDLSFSQEMDNSKQSLFDFNNLIYIVDKKTHNIINDNIKNKTKIKSQYIKDLLFICNYKDYLLYKDEGIFPINEFNLEKVGIPKEIYNNKGLNYFRNENYIEVFFVKEMKMIKILDLDNNEEKNESNKNKFFNNKQINNINIIHNINNFNNIQSFSKNTIQIEKDIQSDSISKNFYLIKQTKDNRNEELTLNNIKNELMNSSIDSIISDNSLNMELDSIPELIFQTLLFLAEEENTLLNDLDSKISIKKVSDYYLISSVWLDEYKTTFNYNEIKNLYKDKIKNNNNYKNRIISEKIINDLINNNPVILDSIREQLNSNLSKFKDFKKMRFSIENKNINNGGNMKLISIPYELSLINKNILDLIIRQFDFTCINVLDKKDECDCEFCKSTFLKRYECYIGNHIMFIYNNNVKNKNFNYYLCKNSDSNNISNIKLIYLFLFTKIEGFISEINNYFSQGKKLKEYLRIKGFDKNEIIQDLYDVYERNVGQIINIKILINKEEEIILNNQLKNLEKNFMLRVRAKRNKTMKRGSLFTKPLLLYKKPALIGLNRNGQPYFFNAVLQCLSNIPELTNFFLCNNFANDENAKVNYPFCYNYSQLINELWKKPSEEESEVNNYPYYKKSFFAFQIKEYLLNVNSSVLIQQKDVFRELFIYIIKLLDNELNQFESEKSKKFRAKTLGIRTRRKTVLGNIRNNDTNKSNNQVNNSSSSESSYSDSEEQLLKDFRFEYHGKFNSVIQKNFYSEIEVFFHCIKCEIYNFHYEIVNSFTFDLEVIKNNFLVKYKFRDVMKKRIILNLEDCFEYVEKPNNILQILTCTKCDLNTLEKQIRILKSSNILVLFFKEKESLKIEFEIPFDLPLNAFIHDQNDYENKNHNNLKFKRNSYDLICVLCNPPDTTKKFKYIAYCKNPVNKCWYCYNDSIVSIVDLTFLKSVKIPKMLIYRKKEIIYLTFMTSDEKTFELEVNIDMFFKDVVSYLFIKHPCLEELNIAYFYFNDKELSLDKNLEQNNLHNGAIILCREDKLDL